MNTPPRLVLPLLALVPVLAACNTTEEAMLVQDLVDRQIWSRRVGLTGAARELGMSPATLKRRFHAMNTSYSKILAQRRSQHAIRLLESSDISIREIAESLGYTAVSNFSRAFAREQGVSPSQWRKTGQSR